MIHTRPLPATATAAAGAGLSGFPNLVPRAKRVIYLFQSGAPSQMDLFDPKPALERLEGTDLPDSIRMGQRLTGMTSRQDRFPWPRAGSDSHAMAKAVRLFPSSCRSPPAWPTSSASSSR